MNYIAAAHSDIGIKKQTNQDSLCMKIAKTRKGQIVLGVICDGMGGLKKGELASATVLRAFSKWFESELPLIMESELDLQEVRRQWGRIVRQQNEILADYGSKNGLSLGTTLSALLLIEDKYLIVQVGDSRVYRIKDELEQLTEDQTIVAMEVKMNKISKEQAKSDPRKNVLLQCIGASKIVEPEFVEGNIGKNEVYLLCSDGFRHEISREEIYGILTPRLLNSEQMIKKSLMDLVELNKSRKEKDNISVLLVKGY